MKKIFALLLMVVMSVTLLAGCGTDPVYEDLSNYLNVEMVEVNAEYENLAKTYNMDVEAVKKAIPSESLAADIKSKKAIDFVKENAKITDEKSTAKKTTNTATIIK